MIIANPHEKTKNVLYCLCEVCPTYASVGENSQYYWKHTITLNGHMRCHIPSCSFLSQRLEGSVGGCVWLTAACGRSSGTGGREKNVRQSKLTWVVVYKLRADNVLLAVVLKRKEHSSILRTKVTFTGMSTCCLMCCGWASGLQADVSALFPSECLVGGSFNKLRCRTRRVFMVVS